ncbi:KIN14B-interacting protein At4g14310 [Nymphaea colorata]|nr:KIN14B-interacting protein At4g14310 [Nymphaea colorata]
MSSSTRRYKERGGGGGKVVAEVLPPPSMPKARKVPSEYSSKENLPRSKPAGKPIPPRAAPRGSGQMPLVQRPPRISNTDSCGESAKNVRWSTSSLPKGKSSDLSEFARFLSDLRRDRLARASKSEAPETGLDLVKKVSELPHSAGLGNEDNLGSLNLQDSTVDLKVSREGKEEYKLSDVDSEKHKNEDISILIESSEKENDSNNVNCTLSNVKGGNLAPKELADASCRTSENACEAGLENPSVDKASGDLKSELDLLLNAKDSLACRLGKELTDPNGDAIAKNSEKEVHLISKCSLGARQKIDDSALGKIPSKLREKLASLEGRVKSIASEIKRTREMLDSNNPDGSKSLILDIQGKICGIERAVGCIMDDKGKLGLPKLEPSIKENEMGIQGEVNRSEESTKCSRTTLTTKSTNEALPNEQIGGPSKQSIKCLSKEELEARLFPHHKLLRNRPPLTNILLPNELEVGNATSSFTQSDHFFAHGDGVASPVEENPIALEFLASLAHANETQTIVNDAIAKLSLCSIHEMESSSNNEDSQKQSSDAPHLPKGLVEGKGELKLSCDEKLQLSDQENRSVSVSQGPDDSCANQLIEIGVKPSTGGWFVSEGESALLAHADGSCTFNDLVHCEEKSEYVPPVQVSPNLWRDIWLIRAAGPDGCAAKYVVAASAGNVLDSGFCSWDFYSKEVRAFHTEGRCPLALSSLSHRNSQRRRNVLSTIGAPENHQWWYKPCGPLIVSTATSQKNVSVYDIRDSDLVMRWETQTPVATMDFSSPLQWRNKEKVVVAESEAISLWDVSSLNPRVLSSISCYKRVSALHIHNTDAEFGGGVRQRVSSSEAEGNDGVFCTSENLNVFDFRIPSGIGLRIPKPGVNGQSLFARGDSVFLGSVSGRLTLKEHSSPTIQHFSLRKGRLVSTYSLPDASYHNEHSSLTQVWGSSDLVMAASGCGLFVFDVLKDEGMQFVHSGFSNVTEVREVIGSDTLYCPSFDYAASRVLLISRDQPASWRFLS